MKFGHFWEVFCLQLRPIIQNLKIAMGLSIDFNAIRAKAIEDSWLRTLQHIRSGMGLQLELVYTTKSRKVK